MYYKIVVESNLTPEIIFLFIKELRAP